MIGNSSLCLGEQPEKDKQEINFPPKIPAVALSFPCPFTESLSSPSLFRVYYLVIVVLFSPSLSFSFLGFFLPLHLMSPPPHSSKGKAPPLPHDTELSVVTGPLFSSRQQRSKSGGLAFPGLHW